jgi:IS1 family transposase
MVASFVAYQLKVAGVHIGISNTDRSILIKSVPSLRLKLASWYASIVYTDDKSGGKVIGWHIERASSPYIPIFAIRGKYYGGSASVLPSVGNRVAEPVLLFGHDVVPVATVKYSSEQFWKHLCVLSDGVSYVNDGHVDLKERRNERATRELVKHECLYRTSAIPKFQVRDFYPWSQFGIRCIGGPLRGDCSSPHLFSLVRSNPSINDRCRERRPSGMLYRTLSAILALILSLRVSYRLIVKGDDRIYRLSGGVLIPFSFFCGMYGAGMLFYCLTEFFDSTTDCSEFQSQSKEAHNNTVTQKLLTPGNYCNTVLAIGRTHMANVLTKDKQVAVISALAEGSSIRSIERITGVHRDTIMRLGVRVGNGCAGLLDAKMRNLPCRQLQFDEIWGFIGKKERHCTPDDSMELGDVWTFCAIDAETKIVPSFKCGKRDLATANAFVSDVASRMRNRVQISSDALRAYVDAIETNFGADVDFAQIIKTYVTDDSHIPERRFSAPEIVITEKKSISGFPDLRLASTSHVERLNGTTRLHMRRLTRLTYAFSKKLENFNAAVALHFAYYNFVKRHITLRATPAMAAGIERDFWTVGNLVEATV